MSLSGCSRSDADLQKKFQKHRKELDQLVQLADLCFGDNQEKWIWASKALLSEKPCLDLMIPVGVESMFRDKKGTLFLGVRERFGSGELKGYAYSREPLTPVFPSLNQELVGKPYENAYKSLGEGWYLYSMNTNG